ncbi:MAG: hypothetical protein IPP90_21550 [Gemmatimonadaceae bacterium]|nr:hypothetical protein [Gemmatimonadaceae bacterium]
MGDASQPLMLPIRPRTRIVAVVFALLSAFASTAVVAQSASLMTDPLGLPMTRMGSGTSWLPDSAPMYGVMRSASSWMFMLHGAVFVQQVAQRGPRGDSQFGSTNWGMVNAMHSLAGGRLQLRAMGSVDAFTVGGQGYPLLLQSGESYRGASIHDRQHPHDLFMEIAAVYERALTRDVALQLYAAPAGEPALGPVAFPHRPSAAADPLATLSHHWQDATHVSFGVVTTGLYTRRVKLEGSIFNGREPDDIRTNIDWKGAALDSYSGRLTVSPSSAMALSASFGRLADAEQAHPGEAVRRAVVSALWSGARLDSGTFSVALIAGANAVAHDAWSRSVGLEGLTELGPRTQLFARAELVEKSAEELVLSHDETRYRVGHVSVGAMREMSLGRAGRVGIGARGTVNMVPPALEAAYGSRRPLGAAVYLRWRTSRMTMGGMEGMEHMHH